MKENQKEELNIGDWGIVDGPLMREVLDNFVTCPDFSDKVLEIQRIRSIVMKPRIRMFIGQKIRMKDYPAWNIGQINTLNRLRERIQKFSARENIPDFTESLAALCIWEDGPRITPLFRPDEVGERSYALSRMFADIFGETILLDGEKYKLDSSYTSNLELSLWLHINENGKYVLPEFKSKLETKFRIRAMSIETWRQITDDYIHRGCVCPDYVEKDDIQLSQIEL